MAYYCTTLFLCYFLYSPHHLQIEMGWCKFYVSYVWFQLSHNLQFLRQCFARTRQGYTSIKGILRFEYRRGDISSRTIAAQSPKLIATCFFQFDYILLDRSVKISPHNSQLLWSNSV